MFIAPCFILPAMDSLSGFKAQGLPLQPQACNKRYPLNARMHYIFVKNAYKLTRLQFFGFTKTKDSLTLLS